MKGQCRFLRVQSGITHFARVQVQVHPGDDVLEIEDGLPESIDPGKGEVNRQANPTWVDAALNGIREAVQLGQQQGAIHTGCRVVLTRLVGTAVDTRPDAVFCAAGLAIWDALGNPSPALQAYFDGEHWNLMLPTPDPVHGHTTS